MTSVFSLTKIKDTRILFGLMAHSRANPLELMKSVYICPWAVQIQVAASNESHMSIGFGV